jgi:hypothetical protein
MRPLSDEPQKEEGGTTPKKKDAFEEQPSVRPEDRPSVRPYARTPVRRQINRYAFEFFQDQVDSLRAFSLQERLRGEKGSMSEMVREAVDAYITSRDNRKV